MNDQWQGPHPILSLQWSIDSCFILSSTNEENYQELILCKLLKIEKKSKKRKLYFKISTVQGICQTFDTSKGFHHFPIV